MLQYLIPKTASDRCDSNVPLCLKLGAKTEPCCVLVRKRSHTSNYT